MDNYGTKYYENNKLLGYIINKNEGVIVNKYSNDNGEEYNDVTVKSVSNNIIDKNSISFLKWIDIKQNNGFIRKYNNLIIYFNNEGNIYNIEGEFNSPHFPINDSEYNYNNKIGTIDFETFGENGLGNQQVYAGGWCTEKYSDLIYIEKGELPENVIKKTIESIFAHKELDNYVFYGHNFGRFDSLFIIKAVKNISHIEIDPIFKDNQIISMRIKNTQTNMKIKFYDSINLINGSLDIILKNFNCQYQKGIFPYNFVNENNLFYIGTKPKFDFYENINFKYYNKIPNNNWNLKNETLKYLNSDIKGLLEVLIKFSKNIFNDYSINITSYSTLPSLNLAIFTTKYYNEQENNICMIKGKIEEDIRTAYFGGNVDVFINEIDKGYLYDMNSQYPFAMLNDMPIGKGKFTMDKNLNNLFGFVYGTITAPSEDLLRIPFIQFRDEQGNVTCPRGKFQRLIFTEEIKDALNYGYKIDIEYGYVFDRGKNLFKNYIDYHYDKKKNATDIVTKQIAKLMLNSLYGKFGMKEIYSKLKFVDSKTANRLNKNFNTSIFAKIDENLYLIKYSSKISEKLRILFKNSEENNNLTNFKDIGLIKSRGVPSAVHIAAAISAYARISINKYKNIPGNPCIMSDTDSVVLPNKLNDSCIGKELGQMKLEHEIKYGIFMLSNFDEIALICHF